MRSARLLPSAVLALATLLAAACDDDEEPTSEASSPSESGGEQASKQQGEGSGDGSEEEDPPLFTRSRPMMGTVFRVTVAGASPEEAAPAVDRALGEIARLETVLSEWLPDSDISRINDAAGDHPVEVSKDTFAVVKAGLDVSRWSDGAFDLSWAALRGLYDFRPGKEEVPERREVKERVSSIDWKQIVMDEQARTVFLKKPDMAIGTGGIAKGYALDRAGDILEEAGLESFMLFGGGQVQVHGMRIDRPWRVGIQHPREPKKYFAFFEATDGSISTSGDYEHFFFDEQGTRWHHILDPRRGMPARRSLSVTILAPTGLYADALSTAAFVLGPEGAKKMFEEMPYRAEMVMVDADCRLVVTEGTDERLKFRMEVQEGVLTRCRGRE